MTFKSAIFCRAAEGNSNWRQKYFKECRSDLLLHLPISPSSQIKSPSAHTLVSLDPNKDLNFGIIEKQIRVKW
jgi:hypothetical protein